MKHKLILIVLWATMALAPIGVSAQVVNDSLLKVLDETIARRGELKTKKHQTIGRLMSEWGSPDMCYALFHEYISFRMDSALYYAKIFNRMMEGHCTDDSLKFVRMTIADAIKGMGQYNEALGILNEIDIEHTSLSAKSVKYYWHLRHSLFHLQYLNSIDTEQATMYRDSVIACKQRMLTLYKPTDLTYQIIHASLLMFQGKPVDAQHDLVSFLRGNESEYKSAVLAATLSEIYHELGQIDKEEEFLIRASIIDLEAASKKYTALQKLAILLYKRGDIDRAYKYITCALEDVTFCNARCRMFEIAEYLPIITSAYNTRSETYRERYLFFAITLVVLLAFLAYLVIALNKRNVHLNTARNALDETNASLKQLNQQLLESNRIKEEYIGQAFNICSSYIEKQESLRKAISNKIKCGQISELSKMVDSKSQANDEMKEFFASFDAVFLTLFPDFVENFNKLLLPDEQIRVKEGELLTPELRIYALVRLGINDSTKIAGFLHFSPQTVYNYRLRMHNKSRVDRDEFTRLVATI